MFAAHEHCKFTNMKFQNTNTKTTWTKKNSKFEKVKTFVRQFLRWWCLIWNPTMMFPNTTWCVLFNYVMIVSRWPVFTSIKLKQNWFFVFSISLLNLKDSHVLIDWFLTCKFFKNLVKFRLSQIWHLTFKSWTQY